MRELTTIELCRDEMEFSAGHFTIFSESHREKMHGHNFKVYAALEAEIQEVGMAFDYTIYKKILRDLCKKLDGYFLLPTESHYLRIVEEGNYYHAYFNEECLPFLKSDVILLPLKNLSIEELAKWFVEQLTADRASIEQYRVHSILVKVYSAPGQSATAYWHK